MFAKSLITRGASASTGEGVPEPGDNWDNKSLVLNGQNQYVVCCNTAVQTELQKASGGGRLFKLHFWFKRTASRNTSQDEQTLWNNGDVDANKILSIFIDDQGTEIKIRKGDGSGVSVSSSGLNITNDQWHHLEVGILDNGHKLVLDGDYANLYSGTDVWASVDSSEIKANAVGTSELDLSIAPTWSGIHKFEKPLQLEDQDNDGTYYKLSVKDGLLQVEAV